MEQWAKARQDELTEVEEEFLEACRKQQHFTQEQALANQRIRRALRTSTIIAGLASLLLVAAILLGIQSNRNQRTTQMQVLLNASSIELQNDKRLGTMLAYQALKQFGDDHGEVEQGLANIAHTMQDRVSKQTPFVIPNLNNGVGAIALIPSDDGQILAAGYSDGNIYLIDMVTRSLIGKPLTGHTANVSSLAVSPDGKLLASGSYDNTVILWNVETQKPIGKPLTGHTGQVTSVAFSLDGKTLASGSYDNTVILWAVETQERIGAPLSGHGSYVTSVAFSPDGKTLASGSWDDTIILWDVTSHEPIGEPLAHHTDWVNTIAFSPDGKILASGGDTGDRTVILWDVATHQPIGEPLIGDNNNVTSLAFSPDGKTLAAGDNSSKTNLWDVATRQIKFTLSRSYGPVTGLAFSSDGKTLAESYSSGSEIRLWDTVTGEQKDSIAAPVQKDRTIVAAMTISSDGDILGITQRNLITWDRVHSLNSNTEKFDVDNPIQGLESIYHLDNINANYDRISAFSSDGKYRIEGGYNFAIVWDVASGEKAAQVRYGAYDVKAVAFSQDGKYVASASTRSALVSEAKNGDVIARIKIEKDDGIPISLSFSPDASRLAIAYNDEKSTVVVWDIATKQKVLVIANRQIQPLGYTVASSTNLISRKPNEPGEADQAQNKQTGNPVADIAYLQDGLFILYDNGIVDQWDIWPSRADLEKYATRVCGSCDLTNQQRVTYGLYTWTMRAHDYAGYPITFFMIVIYGLGTRRIYRTVFKSPAPIDPNAEPDFTWKKFLSASMYGAAVTLIGFLGWGIIGFFETIIYYQQARDPLDAVYFLAFLLLPLGLWAGGVYGYLTRSQSGKLTRTKRTLIGAFAGVLSGSISGTLGAFFIDFIMERDLSYIINYDLGVVFGGLLMVGIVEGFISLFGALAYIFVLQPWAEAKKMTHAVMYALQLLFGVGIFFVDKKAKRKWIYPIAVLAMISFWLLVAFDLDYNYLGVDLVSDDGALLLGIIGLFIHIFGLFDLRRSIKYAEQPVKEISQTTAETVTRTRPQKWLQIWWKRGNRFHNRWNNLRFCILIF